MIPNFVERPPFLTGLSQLPRMTAIMSFHEYVLSSSAHTAVHDAFLKVSSNKPAVFLFGAVAFLTWRLLKSLLFNVKAPYAGYESSWEPAWLISLRCSREAPQLIDKGYQRVSKPTRSLQRLGTARSASQLSGKIDMRSGCLVSGLDVQTPKTRIRHTGYS